MTSLFQARRRAEEFAAVVDGSADNRTQRHEEFTTLLGLVASLRDQAAAEPRAEFAADLRSRLMLEAETALKPETATLRLPARQRGRRERRLVAAASAFVLIGGTTTMAAAAQSALPGDALYPIKRGLERAEVGLSMSSAGKGKDLLSQASDRLVEVEGLLGADTIGSGPQVPETLAEFSASAGEGAALLFESFRETGDPDSIVAVRSFTTEGIATLESLAGTVPAEAQGDLTAAAILLRDIDSEAAALCGSCAAELPVVEVPGIFLAHAEVDRALALAAGRELDNDHPVVVDKDTVRAAGGDETTTPSAPAAPTDAPTAPADPTPTTLPSPGWDPSAWPTLLPGVEGGSSTSKKTDEKSLAEQLAQDIDEGLDGVVATLLPETDAN